MPRLYLDQIIPPENPADPTRTLTLQAIGEPVEISRVPNVGEELEVSFGGRQAKYEVIRVIHVCNPQEGAADALVTVKLLNLAD